jgi:hypothetical protein
MRRLLILLLIVLCTHVVLRADNILVGTVDPNPNYGIYPGPGIHVDPSQVVAQSFNLTQPSKVTSIVFWMYVYDLFGRPPGNFELDFTNSLGPGTVSSNVLASGIFTWPSSSQDYGVQYTLDADLTVPAGSYYLVMSTSASHYAGWDFGVETFDVASIGTPFYTPGSGYVNYQLPAASQFLDVGGQFCFTDLHSNLICSPSQMSFQVNGTPVPEPDSLPMIAFGVLSSALWWKMRAASAS